MGKCGLGRTLKKNSAKISRSNFEFTIAPSHQSHVNKKNEISSSVVNAQLVEIICEVTYQLFSYLQISVFTIYFEYYILLKIIA